MLRRNGEICGSSMDPNQRLYLAFVPVEPSAGRLQEENGLGFRSAEGRITPRKYRCFFSRSVHRRTCDGSVSFVKPLAAGNRVCGGDVVCIRCRSRRVTQICVVGCGLRGVL